VEHSARRTVVAQGPRLSDSHGYVERVGNADKVNIPDLQKKLQRRIDLVAETARDWRS
jgi:hypothetical protein